MKKNSVKDIAKLIAEEFNIDSDFNDFMSFCKLIDIGIERLDEIKNEFLYKELSKSKQGLEKAWIDLKPYRDKAKEDKPFTDLLQEIWALKNKKSDEGFQDLAKYLEKRIRETRIKDKTKPKVSSLKKQKRNEKLCKEYYALTEKRGFKQKEALNMLSKKHDLAPETIRTYVKR